MTDHLSTTRNVPIAKVFEYYSNFEKYPERYKLYCQRLDAKQTGNAVTTDEMWNISLGNDISHVKIKVRCTLIPNNTIQYEILEGWVCWYKKPNAIY